MIEAAGAEKFEHPILRKGQGIPHVHGLEQYQEVYKQSIQNPTEFWGNLARNLVTWDKDFSIVNTGSFEHGNMTWFPDGELSPCFNLVDRHAIKNPDSVSLLCLWMTLIL